MLAACVVFLVVASAQTQVTALLNLDRETEEPSLSLDGKTLAFVWCKPDYSCGIYTRPFAGGPVTLFAGKDGHEGSAYSPRWSPDGNMVAFNRFYSHWETHLFTRNASGGEERDLGNVCLGQASWSPDSRFLLTSRETKPEDCRPTLYSAITGQRIRQLAQTGDSATFSPDGRTLAYADGKTLKLLHLDTEYRPTGPAAILVRDPNVIREVLWTLDGKQIIYQAMGDVYRIAAHPGARPQAIPAPSDQLAISQLLTDGSALATETTQIGALWRADLSSTPPKIETVTNPVCTPGAPDCSPDGKTRAFITTRTGKSGIWLANPDGTNERPLVKSIPGFTTGWKGDGVPNLVGWSPDGRWIAFTVFPAHGNADLRSYLYVVPSFGGVLRRLAKEAYALYNASWSRDSKSLYGEQGWSSHDQSHGVESPIMRVDVADGEMTPLGADGIWPLMSSDGKYLYFFDRFRKLSRIPISGGSEERFWDQGNFDSTCAIGSRYLYLFQEPPRDSPDQVRGIVRFDPESKTATTLAEIPFRPRFAYLSPDERYLYFGQQEDPKQRVVLVNGLF